MSIMKAVVLNGEVINIGDWEYTTADGFDNPLPENAKVGDFDISMTTDGRYVITSNYVELRKSSYPSIGDQLDALFKAGVFPSDMANKIMAVKNTYPKQN